LIRLLWSGGMSHAIVVGSIAQQVINGAACTGWCAP
jgi:hypothetical protein